MAVRSGEDRRVGGEPQKLLTLQEAARRLQLPADDVEAMIRQGKLVSFRLGGSHLRVRFQDVEAIRQGRAVGPDRPAPSGSGTFFTASGEKVPDPFSGPASLWERVVDFFYFNDFYIVALLLLLTLLAIILTL